MEDMEILDESPQLSAGKAAKPGKAQLAPLITRAIKLDREAALRLSPLHLAVIEDSLPKARRLLSQGINVNARTSEGTTPLMLACMLARMGMFGLLLRNNAKWRTGDKHGNRASHYADYRRDRDLQIYKLRPKLTPERKKIYSITNHTLRCPDAVRGWIHKGRLPRFAFAFQGNKLLTYQLVGGEIEACDNTSSRLRGLDPKTSGLIMGKGQTHITMRATSGATYHGNEKMLPNYKYTRLVMQFSRRTGFRLWRSKIHLSGRNKDDGRYFASHAEKTLAYYWMEEQLAYAGIPLAQMGKLKDAALPVHRRQAFIHLSHRPCPNCYDFVRFIKAKTGLDIVIIVSPKYVPYEAKKFGKLPEQLKPRDDFNDRNNSVADTPKTDRTVGVEDALRDVELSPCVIESPDSIGPSRRPRRPKVPTPKIVEGMARVGHWRFGGTRPPPPEPILETPPAFSSSVDQDRRPLKSRIIPSSDENNPVINVTQAFKTPTRLPRQRQAVDSVEQMHMESPMFLESIDQNDDLVNLRRSVEERLTISPPAPSRLRRPTAIASDPFTAPAAVFDFNTSPLANSASLPTSTPSTASRPQPRQSHFFPGSATSSTRVCDHSHHSLPSNGSGSSPAQVSSEQVSPASENSTQASSSPSPEDAMTQRRRAATQMIRRNGMSLLRQAQQNLKTDKVGSTGGMRAKKNKERRQRIVGEFRAGVSQFAYRP